MEDIKPGEIYWFIHPKYGVENVLGFVRDHKGGAYVFGGNTGSHYTGHGEGWEKKLAQITSIGYLSLADARACGIVGQDWQPPELEVNKDSIVKTIRGGEL